MSTKQNKLIFLSVILIMLVVVLVRAVIKESPIFIIVTLSIIVALKLYELILAIKNK